MLNTDAAAIFAAIGLALYAGHHIGDYWVQTDHDAAGKGGPGWAGRLACLRHVASYTVTQWVFLALTVLVLDMPVRFWQALPGLAVSAVTHYLADRREFGLMIWLARLIPGKANFLKLGVPREPWGLEVLTPCSECHGKGVQADGPCWDCQGSGTLPAMLSRPDNPSLGTGGWALDQSWHIALGVWLPALITAAVAVAFA